MSTGKAQVQILLRLVAAAFIGGAAAETDIKAAILRRNYSGNTNCSSDSWLSTAFVGFVGDCLEHVNEDYDGKFRRVFCSAGDSVATEETYVDSKCTVPDAANEDRFLAVGGQCHLTVAEDSALSCENVTVMKLDVFPNDDCSGNITTPGYEIIDMCLAGHGEYRKIEAATQPDNTYDLTYYSDKECTMDARLDITLGWECLSRGDGESVRATGADEISRSSRGPGGLLLHVVFSLLTLRLCF
mmetsp:Transcript_49191/g.117122  ORF Transcript_49191/g.117122 Transcript_49191/m.117122 type:complete len:243 (+) Transcript_49191:85-813(+)